MSVAARLRYYRRILPAYLGAGNNQLSFWHETPEVNPHANLAKFGPYYMTFREKAEYAGHHDAANIPMLDYRGAVGKQYNPIAIAQWGLANYNVFYSSGSEFRWQRTRRAADWLVSNLERNSHGVWVWNHHFDWEYREILKAPWYSGLAQGQGISLLLRAHAKADDGKYLDAAERAFTALTTAVADGGVLFEDEEKNLWIEEYIIHPPTHILNGFIWALWGVLDYWRACGDESAHQILDRGVETLLCNLQRYDTGYWSLYELSQTPPKMLASPFYHRLHIVQLRVMATLTGDKRFEDFAERWEGYASRRSNRARALAEKSIFKLLHY